MDTVVTDLFGEEAQVSERLEYEDLYSIYLCERYGLPEGWRCFSLSCEASAAPAGFVRVVGAVAPGEWNAASWRKRDKATEATLFFGLREFEAWKAERERSTGVCQGCSGHRREVASAGVSGTTYRTCRRCKGTGAAPVPAVVP